MTGRSGINRSVTCPTCRMLLTSFAAYITHLEEVHHLSKNELHCPLCLKIYKLRPLYKHHRACSSSKAVKVLCRKCRALVDSDKLSDHFKEHTKKNEFFICPYRHCMTAFGGNSLNLTNYCVYTTMNLYKAHRSTVHSDAEYDEGEIENADDLDAMEEEEAELERQIQLEAFRARNDADDPDDFHIDAEEVGDGEQERDMEGNGDAVEKELFKEKFISLWIRKYHVDLLPQRIVNEVIETLADLAVESSDHLRSKMKNRFPDRRMDVDEVFDQEDWLKAELTALKLKSTYARIRQANALTNVLTPEYVTSFSNMQDTHSGDIIRMRVKDVLLRELHDCDWEPDVNFGLPEEYDYVKNLKRRVPELLSSFRDGERYKDVLGDVPVDQQPPVLLQVYADGLDRDLMGFTSGRNKIHVTCIRNIGLYDGLPRSPSQYKLIQLLNENVKSSNRYEEVMLPLVEDLNQLVQEGIFYRGRKHAVRLVHLQGDGKERAAMFGMCDTFSAVSHCDPWSYLTRETRVNAKKVEQFVKEAKSYRTRATYEVDVANLDGRERHVERLKKKKMKKKPVKRLQKGADGAGTSGSKAGNTRSGSAHKLKSKYSYSRGLKFNSPWNDVTGFHVTDNGALVPCTSHDLYAGVFRVDLARILVSLCNDDRFEWKVLQSQFRMRRLALKFEDRASWHDVICDKPNFKKLPGKHASVHMIIRYFSTMFMNRHPTDDLFKSTAWQLYLLSKKLSELVSSKVYSSRTRNDLKEHVAKYLRMKLKFSEEHQDTVWLKDCCTPKHLWMIHYVNAVQLSGPLCHLETNVAESKNGQLRKHSTKACQTKNVLQTIFKRELLKSAVDVWTSKKRGDNQQPHHTIDYTKMSKNKKKAFTEAGVLTDEVDILKSVSRYGYIFRSEEGQVVAEEEEKFSELLYVLSHKISKQLMLLVRPVKVEFQKHLGLYFVKEGKRAKLLQFKHLVSSRPLFMYEGIGPGGSVVNYFSLHESLPC